MKRNLQKEFVVSFLPVFASILLVISMTVWNLLPQGLFPDNYSPALYSKDGQLLSTRIAVDSQWRFSPIHTLPEKYKAAVIAFEDQRFELHSGVDPIAIARAFVSNIYSSKVVSGGSTITMQTIRLIRGNPPRTLSEKMLEAILALRLEMGFSKDEILNLYANHAPFGGNVVGISTASWRYFGRPLDELSWGESAALAVLPNSPGLIRPGKNQQLFKNKRDKLLHKLFLQGKLTEEQFNLAKLEPLPDRNQRFPRYGRHLLDSLASQYSNKKKFYSHLDLATQKRVEQLGRYYGSSLEEQKIGNLAAIVIDNHTFQVRAYLGNHRVSFAEGSGLAMDIIQRPRSTGSLLKPFLYTLMVDQGKIMPSQLVADLPVQIDGYMPENFDRQFRGAVPAQQALAQSLNVPAVRMLQSYGVPIFYQHLKKLGMTTLSQPAGHYGLPLILGGADTTLWEITQMYANLAHIAQSQEANFRTLELIEHNRNTGKSASENYEDLKAADSDTEASIEAIYSRGAAWLTLEALVEVNRPGELGYWKSFNSSQKIAWKTGTSYGHKDAWAIGVTPNFTVGVWAGNANGEGVAGLTGTQTASPFLFEIFSALGNEPWFKTPEIALKKLHACKDNGYLANRYCDTEEQWVPNNSFPREPSPHHYLIHLDKKSGLRADSRCESIDQLDATNWFKLPPAMEYFYRRSNGQYKTLPPWRSDCLKEIEEIAVSIVYPPSGTKAYIPIQLDNQRSSLIASAALTRMNSRLFWHLNGEFIGSTKEFHEMPISASPGIHHLVVVDEEGNMDQSRFEILGK